MKSVLILAAISLVLLSQSAYALNVGVAPLVVDLGEVQPGSEVYGSFYLMSDAPRDIVVDIQPVRTQEIFFKSPRGNFNSSLSSEEGGTDWVMFFENPIIVPSEKFFVSSANAWVNKKMDFMVKIPYNAEPGYHVIQMVPSPRVTPESTGGVAVGIITVVKVSCIFRVAGDAVRNARILGLDYSRTHDKYEDFYVLIKNTGALTQTVRLEEILIDLGNETIRVPGGDSKVVRPNTIVSLKSRYDVSGKELGAYNANAKISWIGGQDEKDGIIEIVKYREPPSITGGAVAPLPGAEFPFWIAPTFIILFAIVIYWWHNGKA